MRARAGAVAAVLCLGLVLAGRALPARGAEALRPAPAAAAAAGSVRGWTEWRGSAARDGLSPSLPAHLPASARFLWRRPLSGQSLGGVAATPRLVVVSDSSASRTLSLWRGLAADHGEPLWTVPCEVPATMDFTNAPRATPVLTADAIYLLSAFGNLLCVDPEKGTLRWRVDLLSRFGGTLPTWGFCGTPLLVEDLVVVQTPAPKAALVALDRRTGKLRWRSPGAAPGYGSLILGVFGGRRQIIGHDQATLGGWDPGSGRRLWRLAPPQPGDFNVPTPLPLGDCLLVATENNGARLLAFIETGEVRPQPLAQAPDFAPDTVSPVCVDGRLWGFNAGRFRCLDVAGGLRQVWEWDGQDAGGHVSLIGGQGRVLACTHAGALLLFPARPSADTQPERLQILAEDTTGAPEVWSHPALVGTRLYLRSRNEAACLDLE